MTETSFDLVDIIRTIQKRRLFIIIVTIICMVLAGIFLAVRKPKYKAAARFLVNNPLYGDRMTLFRQYESRWVDYFGGDDDVDKVAALATSDTVKGRIIRNCQFQVVYDRDINDPKGYSSLMQIFDKNFNLKRSEYKDMEVSYIAYDPVTAANVANMSVKVLEETWRNYYTSMKMGMGASISGQLTKIDSSISVLTDSLANMRDRHGIYAIISPSRQSVGGGELRGSGKGYGRAVEEIQNIESVKDQLVTDRAHYISILNEFEATTSKSMEFLKVTSRAIPPTSPTGAGVSTVLIAAALLGVFFSSLWVLISAYYSKLNAVTR
ncbi:MAG: Wzz/FepE/Etk N-terminal domain-containing protein [Bacteroidota bacterium]